MAFHAFLQGPVDLFGALRGWVADITKVWVRAAWDEVQIQEIYE
jgi:hypothetical protein